MTINAPLSPKSKKEQLEILLDAASEAYDFIEYYCKCPARNIVAKKLRRAISAGKLEVSE